MAITKALMSGVSEKLFDAQAVGAANSDTFALLPRATLVTWQTYYGSAPASITILLQTSNDGTNWNTTATTTAVGGEIGSFQTSAKFIRARNSAVAGGSTMTVEIVAKPVG